MCRVCFGTEDDGPLVQPCACRGSAKWARKHCVDRWRRTAERKNAAHRCGQYLTRYGDALSIELLSARLQDKRTNGQSTFSTLDSLIRELQVQDDKSDAGLSRLEVLAQLVLD